MYGIKSLDPKVSLATALTYWCFKCRDRRRSPANGVETWNYLKSSITNAATPSKNLTDYIENLCKKLVVPSLRPVEWTRIIRPSITIQRVVKEDGRILELYDDQDNEKLLFCSWEDIIAELTLQGITDRHILKTCLKYPSVICAFARVRYEEDKAIGQDEIELESETIDV